MKKAIGLLEFKSIARGIEVTNQVVKSSEVQLLMSNAICPGKYITVICGDVGAVRNAVQVGEKLGGVFHIESILIPNVHDAVFPALSGTANFDKIQAIGVVETMSALSAILVADTAVKETDVELLEVRLARGLGGKGFAVLTGELSSVERAVEACQNKHGAEGMILCTAVVATPDPQLIQKLFT